MRVRDLLEAELPSALDMVQLLLKKGEPVLLTTFGSENGWEFWQILRADNIGTYTAFAGEWLAGKKYVSVETYGEGHFSWLNNGTGLHNGSIHIPVPIESVDFDLAKLKVLPDRPPMFVFGTEKTIAKLKGENEVQ